MKKCPQKEGIFFSIFGHKNQFAARMAHIISNCLVKNVLSFPHLKMFETWCFTKNVKLTRAYQVCGLKEKIKIWGIVSSISNSYTVEIQQLPNRFVEIYLPTCNTIEKRV
jgi:hypothetical protein